MEPDLSIREITQLQVEPQLVGFNSFLLILTVAGAIFGFFYLVSHYLFPLIESEKRMAKMKRLSFRVQVATWAVFTLLTLTHLLLRNPLIVTIILLVVALVGLSFWRDFFPGLFFRIAQTYSVNDPVAFNDLKGRIEKIGYTTIQLRTDKDELVFIPYRKIEDQMLVKQQAKGKLLSANIILPMVETDRVLIHEKVEKWLRNCPWAVQQHQLTIRIIETGKAAVTVHAIDQSSIAKIEDYLLQKVSN